MSAGEMAGYRWRQVRGLIQDYVGRLTGSHSKRVKGHGKMVGGEVQHRTATARDQVKDTGSAARDKLTGG